MSRFEQLYLSSDNDRDSGPRFTAILLVFSHFQQAEPSTKPKHRPVRRLSGPSRSGGFSRYLDSWPESSTLGVLTDPAIHLQPILSLIGHRRPSGLTQR
jgi:hypothetical protein